MRFLSLFAGIGGFDLGLERAGHECAGQVEIDAFCGRVLGERFNAPRWTDVREWAGDGHESVDLLCGGFPCQDLSVAGKRAGLGGERSGLFWEIVRIAKAIRPAWGLFENVPGLLSSRRGADMWTVLAGLRECWPVVGYRILDSRHFGVAQRRRRVFFVCGPTEAGVRAVLFEPEGGARDSQEGGEARQELARDVAASLRGVGDGKRGWCGDAEQGLTVESEEAGARVAGDVARSITGTCFKRHDEDTDTIVTALRHMGNGGPDDNEAQGGHLLTWNWQSGGDVRHSLGLPNLQASQVPATGVRRLTPLECERLQGFPDGWSCLCQPMSAYQEDADEAALFCKCPDSPRYRALGNAVTVSVVSWIGNGLRRVQVNGDAQGRVPSPKTRRYAPQES